MGLKQCLGVDTGVDPHLLPELCALVAKASGRGIPGQKSLIGEWVFTHESGLHVDGMLKDPRNYQGVDPALLGREHRLVLGKHSGSRAVIAAYAQLGVLVSDQEAHGLLERIRDHATCTKRSPSAGELARYGRDSRVQGLSAAEAHGFLTGMDADAVVPQAHRAAARGAVWDAFFRQNLDLLPGALPQAFGAVENARVRVWLCGKCQTGRRTRGLCAFALIR